MSVEQRLSEMKLRSLSTIDIIHAYHGVVVGHTVFRTGEHGNGYVEKMRFLQDAVVLYEMGRRIAEQFSDKCEDIDVVSGPVHVGAVLAAAVAYHLQKIFTLTYKEMRSGKNIQTGQTFFHRAGIPDPGSNILLIDDFVATGNGLREIIQFIRSQHMVIVGVGVIGQRMIDLGDLATDIRSLTQFDLWKTNPEHCQLCNSGVPIMHTNIRE